MKPPSPQPQCQFELLLPLDRSLLAVVRRFVSGVAEEMGFPPEDACKIELSVDEACSNAMVHAYRGPARRRGAAGVRVKLVLDPAALTIYIEDEGRGLRSTERLGAPSLADYQAPGRARYNGLGVLIMKEMMDDVHFFSQPGSGAIVRLTKRRRAGGRRAT